MITDKVVITNNQFIKSKVHRHVQYTGADRRSCSRCMQWQCQWLQQTQQQTLVLSPLYRQTVQQHHEYWCGWYTKWQSGRHRLFVICCQCNMGISNQQPVLQCHQHQRSLPIHSNHTHTHNRHNVHCQRHWNVTSSTVQYNSTDLYLCPLKSHTNVYNAHHT